MKAVWAIGLMTGTALDGFVDAALIKTDGVEIFELGEFILHPYNDNDREILSQAVQIALKWNFNGEAPVIFEDAKRIITKIYSKAVFALLDKAKMKPDEIAYIGGHGLTLVHRPPLDGKKGQTLQILDGQELAKITNIKTVYDFRTNDMEHGGQGAPLAPIYHAALLRYANLKPPCAILNLGGVANITYWGGNDDVIAFDCGPANGPLNELIEKNGLGTYDKDGLIAAKGKVSEDTISKIISNAWFNAPYPKSLDRYDFDANLVSHLSIEDGAATLCALIGECVDKALSLLPKRPKTLVLAGGGRKNPIIINQIESRAQIVTIDADEIGLRGDAVEAECFGYLAKRAAENLPISFPNTTGVKSPISGATIGNP